MATTSSLIQLPPEIIIRVASNLNTVDFGKLRQTCKWLDNCLFDTLCKEFFTKRQFMIEHESLQCLLDIAHHPRLGPNLQEVIIGTQQFDPNRHDNDPWPARMLEERNERQYMDKASLLATGKAHSMLNEAFSKLINVKTIGLRDFDREGRYRDGPHSRWRSWGWTKSDSYFNSPDVRGYFPLILSALSASKVQPERIDVFLRDAAQLGRDSFSFGDKKALEIVLSQIKTMMLSIRFPPSQTRNIPEAISQYHLRQFIQYLINVEHLRLNFGGDGFVSSSVLKWLSGPPVKLPNSTPSDYLPSTSLSNLTTLELGMACLGIDTTVAVLTRFPLRKISLWRIVLMGDAPPDPDENCWNKFLTRFATNLQPDSLHSLLIGQASQAPLVPIGWGEQKKIVMWSGPDIVDGTPWRNLHRDIEYNSKCANKSSTEWLEEYATMAKLPPPRTRPRRSSSIESSEMYDSDEDPDMSDEDIDDIEDLVDMDEDDDDDDMS